MTECSAATAQEVQTTFVVVHCTSPKLFSPYNPTIQILLISSMTHLSFFSLWPRTCAPGCQSCKDSSQHIFVVLCVPFLNHVLVAISVVCDWFNHVIQKGSLPFLLWEQTELKEFGFAINLFLWHYYLFVEAQKGTHTHTQTGKEIPPKKGRERPIHSSHTNIFNLCIRTDSYVALPLWRTSW